MSEDRLICDDRSAYLASEFESRERAAWRMMYCRKANNMLDGTASGREGDENLTGAGN